jgi:uncharacterized protein YyaL (SSP411 family)
MPSRASERHGEQNQPGCQLITRPRDLQDNAAPSGNAMAVTALLKLAGFTDELRTIDIAHQALAQMQSMVAQ